MREITTTVYTFDELSEKAKEKAREWYREGALDYSWWEHICLDAESIGLEITEFDLDRGRSAKGKLRLSHEGVANKIIKEHGLDCDTRKAATNFLHEVGKLDENDGNYDDRREVLEREFAHVLLEDYAMALQKEYEWLLSNEQVDESIRVNEYEFTDEGIRA